MLSFIYCFKLENNVFDKILWAQWIILSLVYYFFIGFKFLIKSISVNMSET